MLGEALDNELGNELGLGESVGDTVGCDVGSPGKKEQVVLHKVYPTVSSGIENTQLLGAPPLAIMIPSLFTGVTLNFVRRTSHRISSDHRPPEMVA
jgi:hypothetical protein